MRLAAALPALAAHDWAANAQVWSSATVSPSEQAATEALGRLDDGRARFHRVARALTQLKEHAIKRLSELGDTATDADRAVAQLRSHLPITYDKVTVPMMVKTLLIVCVSFFGCLIGWAAGGVVEDVIGTSAAVSMALAWGLAASIFTAAAMPFRKRVVMTERGISLGGRFTTWLDIRGVTLECKRSDESNGEDVTALTLEFASGKKRTVEPGGTRAELEAFFRRHRLSVSIEYEV